VTPSAEAQIQFLQDLQRILEEGLFTASYKYALLLSLADLAVERGDDSGDELPIALDDIAETFIRYYWRQSRPYPRAGGGVPDVLWQNTGKQAAIVTLVSRHAHATLVDVMRDGPQWTALRGRARSTIVDQPLWKLQRVGDRDHDFLYPQNVLVEGRIMLRPGVAFCLRRFHTLIYDLVTAAWLRFVRELRPNQRRLGQTADLSEFLFGTERADLKCFRPILLDIQKGECFYCPRRLTASAEVDHFIPWARYPVDLGHNFVLADPTCNNQKRDRLAAVPHLERWARRNDDHGTVLAERFAKRRIVHDAATSLGVARWAYAQAHDAGALAWERADVLVPISRDWASAVGL
jgi:5-methylcytosine-specific restriction endonuclease McrA